MTLKTTLIALSTALALSIAGATSVAQAGGDSGEYHGGFKIGPLGQRFPTHGRAFAFAYVPRWHHRHYAHHYYEY
jgi:hypothetical protein